MLDPPPEEAPQRFLTGDGDVSAPTVGMDQSALAQMGDAPALPVYRPRPTAVQDPVIISTAQPDAQPAAGVNPNLPLPGITAPSTDPRVEPPLPPTPNYPRRVPIFQLDAAAQPTNAATQPAADAAAAAATPDGHKDLPTYAGGPLDKDRDALIALMNETPAKISRKRAALAGGLRGLGIGLQEGSLGAGIGAGLTGVVGGAVAPHRQAVMEQDARVARAYGDFSKKAKVVEAAADVEAKQAQAIQRRNAPAIAEATRQAQARKEEIAAVMTMHGRLDQYDPKNVNDPGSQAVLKRATALGIADWLAPFDKDTKDKVPPTREVDGVAYERGKDGAWAEAKGLPHAARVQTEFGPVAPGTALTAKATAAAATRQEGQFNITQDRITQERFDRRNAEASGHYGKWQEADTRMRTAQQKLDNATSQTDPDDVTTWKEDLAKARGDKRRAAGDLEAYPEFYKISQDENGPWVTRIENPTARPATQGPGRKNGKGSTGNVQVKAGDTISKSKWIADWVKNHPNENPKNYESDWNIAVEDADRRRVHIVQ